MVSFTAHNSKSEFHRVKRLIDVYQFVCNVLECDDITFVEELHDHEGHLTVSIYSTNESKVKSIESVFKEAWEAFREDGENVSVMIKV